MFLHSFFFVCLYSGVFFFSHLLSVSAFFFQGGAMQLTLFLMSKLNLRVEGPPFEKDGRPNPFTHGPPAPPPLDSQQDFVILAFRVGW